MPPATKHDGGLTGVGHSRPRFTSFRAGLPAILSSAAALWALLFGLAAFSYAANKYVAAKDADTFVREVLQHEYDAQLRDHALWAYREVKKEDGKSKVYSVYQTDLGEVDRLTAVNGQPLTPKQAQIEDARLDRLLHRPADMRAEQHKQAEDAARARNLLKMFPAAFHYQYDGRQGELVRLKFTPNPDFHDGSRATQVFHHMEGTMLLDADHQRLLAIHGTLTSEVKFGYGLLGYLAPGGTFDVQQSEVSPGFWEVTSIDVEMFGKALFFKTIGAHEDESYSDFQRVPDDASLQQAAAFVRRGAMAD